MKYIILLLFMPIFGYAQNNFTWKYYYGSDMIYSGKITNVKSIEDAQIIITDELYSLVKCKVVTRIKKSNTKKQNDKCYLFITNKTNAKSNQVSSIVID